MAVTIQLKDFTAKAAPVPADIIYGANSADSFNEVQMTIEDLIAAYPALASIGSLTTAANEYIYTTAENTYAAASITAFGRSVLALSAATTAPAAGALAGWDANKNLSASNFLAAFVSTPSAAGTLTLTVASAEYQEITGATTHTVQLPVPSTLVAGTPYTIINNSSGLVTVNSSGGNLVQTLASGTQLDVILLINSGTTAASWQTSYIPDVGVLSVNGTVNQIVASGPTGNVTLSLPASVQIVTSLLDANALTMLSFSATALAVNYFNMTNSAAGLPPSINALGSDTNILLQLNGKGTSGVGIQGVATNAAAAAGNLGEVILGSVSAGSAVSLTSSTATNIASIQVTPGRWMVCGNIEIGGSAVSMGLCVAAVSLISASLPAIESVSSSFAADLSSGAPATIGDRLLSPSFAIISVSVNTNVYLIAQSTFSGGTGVAWGKIIATRI